ncbi:MAG: response regulator transcription factor [bacterium]
MAKIKVAIVEDNAGVRNSLAKVIRASDNLICAGLYPTGEVALERLPQEVPDVVLMDINLPGISGIETTAGLKELLPNLDVIVITVYEDADNVFNALKAGACGYLLKRSTAKEVRDAIEEVSRGGAPMTSEIARKVVAVFQESIKNVSAEYSLSPRDKDIMNLLCQGFSNKEISDKLGLTPETVCWYLKTIYKKLHVHSRTQAVIKFKGMTSPAEALS